MERKSAVCILTTSDEGRKLFDYVLSNDVGDPYPLEENLAFTLEMFTDGVFPLAGDGLEEMLAHLRELALTDAAFRKTGKTRKSVKRGKPAPRKVRAGKAKSHKKGGR